MVIISKSNTAVEPYNRVLAIFPYRLFNYNIFYITYLLIKLLKSNAFILVISLLLTMISITTLEENNIDSRNKKGI